MQPPRKAIVLAAGFGVRMLPLSLEKPKPLMPFWGKPILEHTLDLLARWGVRETLINLHHLPDQIVERLRAAPRNDMLISFSFEPAILGTGGALARAAWFVGDRPFWIVNADVVADLDPAPMLDAFASGRCLAALWLHPDAGPRTVEMTRGRITNFQSSRPGTSGTYTFCGLHLAASELLRHIPGETFCSIIGAYNRALAGGRRIAGVCLPGSFWADAGTPAGYIAAHREALARRGRREPGGMLAQSDALRRMRRLRRGGVEISGFASVAADAHIAKGARLSDAVVWDGARVAAGSVIDNAVVGCDVTVRGNVTGFAVRSDFALRAGDRANDPQLAAALARLRWNPRNTAVIPFEPRGSARSFARLEHRGQSAIMIRYSLERHENALHGAHARFLKTLGWPAPNLLADMPEKQLLLFEDLGDRSLQQVARRAGVRARAGLYRRVLRDLRFLHAGGARAARRAKLELVAPFSPDLYRWEREFFARQFLAPRLHLPDAAIAAILRELAAAANLLLREPAVLVHRDLQSSNILLAGNKPFFIDFQGMRLGAAAYDLASLLCDPYVELPAVLQKELLAFYNALPGAGAPVRENIFWLAAVQRLAQVLGAFGRFCAQADTARFGRHIPAALRMMRRALQHCGGCPRLAAAVDAAL